MYTRTYMYIYTSSHVYMRVSVGAHVVTTLFIRLITRGSLASSDFRK